MWKINIFQLNGKILISKNDGSTNGMSLAVSHSGVESSPFEQDLIVEASWHIPKLSNSVAVVWKKTAVSLGVQFPN